MLIVRTPAMLMAAATVNIPAISMNVGPMLNGKSTASFDEDLLTLRLRWRSVDRFWCCTLACAGRSRRGQDDQRAAHEGRSHICTKVRYEHH